MFITVWADCLVCVSDLVVWAHKKSQSVDGSLIRPAGHVEQGLLSLIERDTCWCGETDREGLSCSSVSYMSLAVCFILFLVLAFLRGREVSMAGFNKACLGTLSAASLPSILM